MARLSDGAGRKQSRKKAALALQSAPSMIPSVGDKAIEAENYQDQHHNWSVYQAEGAAAPRLSQKTESSNLVESGSNLPEAVSIIILRAAIGKVLIERKQNPSQKARLEPLLEGLTNLLAQSVHARARAKDQMPMKVGDIWSSDGNLSPLSLSDEIKKLYGLTNYINIDEGVDDSFSSNKAANIIESLKRGFLGSGDRDSSLNSIVDRIDQLRDFALYSESQEDIRSLASSLFPEWNIPEADRQTSLDISLPNEAPEFYQGLRGPETPPEFVNRVYGQWLGNGIDRAHIKKLDPKLYVAIDNWSRKNEWPSDVDLPTRGAQNQRTLERLRAAAPDGKVSTVVGDFTAREAARIRSAAQRESAKRQ